MEKRCTTCHEVRPLTDFNVRRSAPDGLQARCRSCSRAWYVGNRDEHIRRVAERNRRVRGEHQERLAAYLIEHPCVDCGEVDLRVLELDHEDPTLKTANVGRLLTSALPWSTVQAEMDKCSVRCANCHRRRTAESYTWWRSSAEAQRRSKVHQESAIRLVALLGDRGPRGADGP